VIAQQILNGLVVGAVYALFALGFTLVYGVQNILDLGHGGVFTLGGDDLRPRHASACRGQKRAREVAISGGTS